MNVGPDHHEPLDAEERAMAGRLARIGPFDGPSPALDAKILRAAHTAVASKRGPSKQRRWLALLGLPPALVTGVGVAAAAVLALGLVWQLRPTPVLQPAMEEDGSASGDEVFVMAEPLPEPRPAVVNPPPLPPDAPVAAPASPQRSQARAPAELAAEAAAKATESTASTAEAATAVAADAAAEAVPAVAPPPVADLRERRAAATAGADTMQEPGFVPAPPAAPPATPTPATAKRRPTYTNSARATSTRREAEAFSAPAPAAQSLPSQAAGAESGQELDQIEVTGSRISMPGPVRDDTRLEPAEWLERIRVRRDAGELDDARESLRLFRKQHPRIRIPDDLRALLVADPDR